MCNKATKAGPWQLKDVPNHLKTQEMCDDMVRRDAHSSQFVPDWFVTQQQIDIQHDEDEYCNDHGLIKWFEGYQKRKAQKAKTKEELLPIIGTHQDGWIGVFLKMKKMKQKNCGHKHGSFCVC